ncbi:NAD-dependent epimerase/dehydratase family protein [Micromonospora sp. M12]
MVIFGATGMVGQGVLRECLLAEDVREVVTVGRRPTGRQDPKLRELTVADVGELATVRDALTAVDACFYCLGVSSLVWTRPRTRGSATTIRSRRRDCWRR